MRCMETPEETQKPQKRGIPRRKRKDKETPETEKPQNPFIFNRYSYTGSKPQNPITTENSTPESKPQDPLSTENDTLKSKPQNPTPIAYNTLDPKSKNPLFNENNTCEPNLKNPISNENCTPESKLQKPIGIENSTPESKQKNDISTEYNSSESISPNLQFSEYKTFCQNTKIPQINNSNVPNDPKQIMGIANTNEITHSEKTVNTNSPTPHNAKFSIGHISNSNFDFFDNYAVAKMALRTQYFKPKELTKSQYDAKNELNKTKQTIENYRQQEMSKEASKNNSNITFNNNKKPFYKTHKKENILKLNLNEFYFNKLVAILFKLRQEPRIEIINSDRGIMEINLYCINTKFKNIISKKVKNWISYRIKEYNKNEKTTLSRINFNKEKCNENDKSEKRNLESEILDLGKWQIVRCLGDGNCAFRAAAVHVFKSQEDHWKVRKAVVDHLIKFQDFFKDFITTDFENYLDNLRKDHIWADDIVLQAISEIYTKKIQIYRKRENEIYFSKSFHEEAANIGNPIKLLFDNEHYDSIIPKNAPRIPKIYEKPVKNAKNFCNTYQKQKTRWRIKSIQQPNTKN